ncbi:NB-ARC domain-containing protein [Streptomyces sp. NBC_00378]|uniref:AfsR/SARP family transcriptional regulator n=1 Tax=unclassified Streptomyces TaxID=2593676 RepID=UPI002253EFA9|nr:MULTISPECIES: AfsR/SARP family transcriptional regulator [unclassified Streptomyces]MCX5114922.1 NB-ARC domain-containing protein [Streptomyces sp. NBC_00378]
MDFRILGPVEARRDGDWIALSGSKVHTVLAAMLLAHGRVVSDSRLGALLWGWDPPVTASAQIYTYMSRLRKLLGDEVEIVRRQPGYVLRAPGARIDVVEFERLDRLGREALRERRHADAQALLTEALGWWRGPALSNVTEFLLEAELPQLEEARMLALENRIEADLALGMHEQVTAELTGLVAEHPVRERLRAQLMTALYRCGRQADALQTYYEGRKVLVDQLGVDPGEVLGATYQAVLGGELGLRGAGAARGRSDVPTMLPAADCGFVGRSAELSLLTSRLAAGTNRPRRLLVTGMAGVGKTALAVRAAEESTGHFPDGQLFAELCDQDGTPKDAGEVLVRLLRALGEPGLDGNSRAFDRDELVRLYRARTSGKRLLVVLDDAVGDLQVAPLLPASPQAAVLITSRARLARVAGADTVALAPLDDDESLAMLAAAAGEERLRDDPDSADDLVAYCGGLPLALAVVGARLAARPSWPARRFADRLADPAERLAELSFGDLDVRAALLPSVRRMAAGAPQALRALSGAGTEPFSARDASVRLAVSEDEAERVLESLVDTALLDLSGLDPQGLPLYRCHELVLLYAASLDPADPAAFGPVSPARRSPAAHDSATAVG